MNQTRNPAVDIAEGLTPDFIERAFRHVVADGDTIDLSQTTYAAEGLTPTAAGHETDLTVFAGENGRIVIVDSDGRGAEIVPVLSAFDVRAAKGDARDHGDIEGEDLCAAALRRDPGAWGRCITMLVEARLAKLERDLDGAADDE